MEKLISFFFNIFLSFLTLRALRQKYKLNQEQYRAVFVAREIVHCKHKCRGDHRQKRSGWATVAEFMHRVELGTF